MLKLSHTCIHFTCQKSNAQTPSSKALTVHESRTSRCMSWIYKRQKNQRSNQRSTSTGSQKKQENSRKTSTSVSLTMLKPLTVQITTNWKISSRDGNTRLSYLPPEKAVCRSRSKLELDVEQWTVSKLGKEYVKAVYCHPAYLTYMQSISCKMPSWIKLLRRNPRKKDI